jgi:nucleotide-binding universal stress UspA family protein
MVFSREDQLAMTSSSFRPQTILLATDFLESSRLALDFAVGFAHHYKSELILLHIFHLTPAAAEAEAMHERPSMSRLSREKRLEILATGVRRLGIDAKWRLEEGWMPERLLERTREIAPDLLVLGTHGESAGLQHMLIGSNAEEVLLSVTCPTLTVGRHVPAGISPDISFEHILYITDLTSESAAAAPYAVALSEEFHARIEVCHLVEGDGSDDTQTQRRQADKYCEAVGRVLPGGEPSWCSSRAQLEHGATADEILKRTANDTAGLVILGVRAETQFGRRLHTSMAYRLVAGAASPVFTVCG